MSTIELFSKEKIRQTFTYATIAVASVCALIGIFMIFFGADNITLLSLLGTIFIFYLISVISIPSIRHLDDRSVLIRSLSVVALIMNAFWAIPWVLMVWDAFGGCDVETRNTIWRLLWTAADIAIFCAIIAGRLVRIRWSDRLQKFFQALPIVCAAFISFDIMIAIWIPEDGGELLFKFICTELILVTLQVIVTQLLTQKMRHEAQQARMAQEVRAHQQNLANAQAASQPAEAQAHPAPAATTNAPQPASVAESQPTANSGDNTPKSA